MASRDDNGFLERLIGVAESAVLVVAPDGAVVLCNEATRRVLALDKAPERFPVPGIEFLTPTGAPAEERHLPWRVALEAGVSVTERMKMRTLRRTAEIRVTAAPLAEDASENLGVVIGICDEPRLETIAELTRLNEDKRQLEEAVAQMPVGCAVMDRDGVVRFENRQMTELMHAETKGTSVARMLSAMIAFRPDGARYTMEDWPGARALGGETVRDEEIIVRPHGGGELVLSVSAAPVRGEDGTIEAVVVIVDDVSVRREAERLAMATADIAAAVNSSLEPDEVMRRVVQAAAEAVGADMALLMMKEEHGWHVQESLGFDQDLAGREFSEGVAPGIIRTFEENRTVLFPARLDVPEETARHRSTLAVGAALCIPVRLRGRPVGVMAFAQRTESPEFTTAHHAFAERLADLVSLALDNANLMTTMREELARTKALHEVSAIATSITDLPVLASRILKAIDRELDMSSGAIAILSEDDSELRTVASLGLPEQLAEEIRRIPTELRGWAMVEAVARDRIVTHDDEAVSPERREQLRAFGGDERRYVAVPARFRGKTLGVLLLAFHGRRPFSAAETELFESIARILGQVVENVRLLESEKVARKQAQSELEVSNLLLGTAAALSRPMELQEVLERLAESVSHATGRSRAIVALAGEKDGRPSIGAISGVTERTVGDTMAPDRTPAALTRALETGRPQFVSATDAELSPAERDQLVRDGVSAGLVVPIVYRGRAIGAILTDAPDRNDPFMEREISLVEAIAAQAGVVIENAKYYDEQHRIAETLQESMLVMPREVEGLEFETLYQSATSAARVGGDFYDLFDISPGRVAMAVGDVSGKGLDASATTALARDTIRAHGITGAPPAVVMSRTNEALLRFTGGETFVTAIYGVLDVESGAFVFTNAGHPDGYVIGRSGYVRPLAGQCPLLGMLDDILFEEQVVVLAPNDTIFFYTDGVTEARRGRELYGSERLVEFLGSLKDNAPGLVTKTLFEELERFSGGALRDDVAMLAVRRVPRGRGDE